MAKLANPVCFSLSCLWSVNKQIEYCNPSRLMTDWRTGGLACLLFFISFNFF